MSNKLLTAVWDHSPADGTDLLVLLALADQANDSGYAWALHSTIARRARIHPDTAKLVIRRLVNRGLVERIQRPGKSNAYRVIPPVEGGSEAPRELPTPGASNPPTPGASNPPGGELPTPHNHVLNPRDEPSSYPATDVDGALFEVPRLTITTDDRGFDDFWAVYPKKVDKPVARKAFAKAIKKTPVSVIISGAERYRNDLGRDPKFTKNPATWLNAESWANESSPTSAPAALNGYARPDGSIDVDAVLGHDVWSPPDPPSDIDPRDTMAQVEWDREQYRLRQAERLELAKDALRQKGYAL